ncbi:carbonyl reductase [NADPH] 3-like [Amphiura filiformis]|uniref:carbonyl reductase [NADPH] 3-like n=1 Tax=Amphiura filiformis TaxID=82378 RepID=UPI003B223777
MARVAVVTGSNKGIGFAIVRALCKQVENGVVYLTSRDEGRGQAAVEELKKENLNPRFHQLDVNDQKSIDRLRDHLVKEHGGLDVLVNNAGIAFKNADPSPVSVQAPVTLATNFDALLAVCHTLFPIIRSHGRVCQVASGSGSYTYKKISDELKCRFKNTATEQDVIQLMQEFIDSAKDGSLKDKGWAEASYGTSKLGVITLSRIQANDIQADKSREDILINSCCPGYVATDMSSYKGHLTIDEGAVTPVYLATLPSGAKEPQGKFLQKKQVNDFW